MLENFTNFLETFLIQSKLSLIPGDKVIWQLCLHPGHKLFRQLSTRSGDILASKKHSHKLQKSDFSFLIRHSLLLSISILLNSPQSICGQSPLPLPVRHMQTSEKGTSYRIRLKINLSNGFNENSC